MGRLPLKDTDLNHRKWWFKLKLKPPNEHGGTQQERHQAEYEPVTSTGRFLSNLTGMPSQMEWWANPTVLDSSTLGKGSRWLHPARELETSWSKSSSGQERWENPWKHVPSGYVKRSYWKWP
jgi:hypothetical protein